MKSIIYFTVFVFSLTLRLNADTVDIWTVQKSLVNLSSDELVARNIEISLDTEISVPVYRLDKKMLAADLSDTTVKTVYEKAVEMFSKGAFFGRGVNFAIYSHSDKAWYLAFLENGGKRMRLWPSTLLFGENVLIAAKPSYPIPNSKQLLQILNESSTKK